MRTRFLQGYSFLFNSLVLKSHKALNDNSYSFCQKYFFVVIEDVKKNQKETFQFKITKYNSFIQYLNSAISNNEIKKLFANCVSVFCILFMIFLQNIRELLFILSSFLLTNHDITHNIKLPTFYPYGFI